MAAIETGLRTAERGKEAAEKKLKSLETRYSKAMGTREQLELEYEEQISEWKAKAGDAEELNAQLSEARGELSGTRAQLESRVTQMEAMQAEREEMRVSAKSREATLA